MSGHLSKVKSDMYRPCNSQLYHRLLWHFNCIDVACNRKYVACDDDCHTAALTPCNRLQRIDYPLSSRTNPRNYSSFPRTIIDWNQLSRDQRLKPRLQLTPAGNPSSLSIITFSHDTPAITGARPLLDDYWRTEESTQDHFEKIFRSWATYIT